MTMRILTVSVLLISFSFFSCSTQDESNADFLHTGKTFRTGCYPFDQDSLGPGLISPNNGIYYYLDTIAIIDVDDFKEVSVSRSTGEYLVNLVLTDDGSRKFTAATEKHLGQSLGFVIENTLVMTPKINEIITGNSIMIDGDFTEDEMLNCYRQLKNSLDNK